jgi:zinc-ribbon domain
MTMYCPNCGTKTSIDQNFCRACGLSLEKTALSLSEQLPAKVDRSVQAQKDRLEKFGVAMLCVFGAGVLTLLLFLLSQKLLDKGLPGILAMLAALILIVCGLGSVILFARAKDLEEKSSKRRQQIVSSGSETTKELLSEGHFEPVPTVTERTTELLAVDKRETNRS